MIIALALMVQDVSISPPSPPNDEEIVVIAKRLESWSGKASMTLGISSCRTTRSTGDLEIDKIGCRVLVDCFVPRAARLSAAAKAAGRDPELRRAAEQPIRDEITACVTERRTALIKELRDRRAQKRSEAAES